MVSNIAYSFKVKLSGVDNIKKMNSKEILSCSLLIYYLFSMIFVTFSV